MQISIAIAFWNHHGHPLQRFLPGARVQKRHFNIKHNFPRANQTFRIREGLLLARLNSREGKEEGGKCKLNGRLVRIGISVERQRCSKMEPGYCVGLFYSSWLDVEAIRGATRMLGPRSGSTLVWLLLPGEMHPPMLLFLSLQHKNATRSDGMGRKHTCMTNKRRLIIETCRGSGIRTRMLKQYIYIYQHLHDDGFLGHFSLLLSDYKENSRNSMGLKNSKSWNNHINFVKRIEEEEGGEKTLIWKNQNLEAGDSYTIPSLLALVVSGVISNNSTGKLLTRGSTNHLSWQCTHTLTNSVRGVLLGPTPGALGGYVDLQSCKLVLS